MWGPSGHPRPPERPQGGPGCRIGPLCPSERKRRRNYTNTLQELAMLLPIPLQASSKKLTKKEILLHVLHYIEHLQRSIDVAKSLLLFQPTDKEACCGGSGAQEECPCPPCEAQTTAGDTRLPPPPWSEPLPRQELVFYDSCEEEEEEEAMDTGPWLSAWPPQGSPHGSPLVDSPRTRSWPGAGQPREKLGLSPSLFTSPGRLLPGKILQEGTENLTQALFEDVCLSPQSSPSSATLSGVPQKDSAPSAPGDPLHALNLFQSSFSLDHCYLSLSETSKTDSSPSSGVTEWASLWNRRREGTPDGFLSSSDEDGDCAWTPTKCASPLPMSGKKRRRSRAGGSGCSPGRPKESKKAHCPFQLKKKCVNGFIMFCRLNRKQYIRACPGTASTAATRELAHLWRVMTKQERRPYCIKARKFSRQHNRIVRQDCSSEEEDRSSPKPFHLLLAEKALYSPGSPGLEYMSSPLRDPLPDSVALL